MKKAELIKRFLFPFIVCLALFFVLRILFEYTYYTIEETNLFLLDDYWLWDKFTRPGGLALLLSKFLIQFFAYPYIGAVIIALLLTIIYAQVSSIFKKVTDNVYILFYLLPVLPVFLVQLNIHYHLQGSIAIIMMLAAFQVFIRIHRLHRRLLYSVLAIPILFYLAGSVSILFAASILFWECLTHPKDCYWFLISVVEAVLISWLSVFFAVVGEFRFAFLPDMYFQPLIPQIPAMLYFTWLGILITLLMAALAGKRKAISRKRSIIENSIQVVIVICAFYAGINQYGDMRSQKFREINYHARTENWERVIELCRGKVDNFLYLMNLNIALSNKGQLADRMFQFDQKGTAGLYPNWNNDYSIAVILSDFHLAAGNIAGAQHFAFEGNVASNNESPRMMKRLVQTYLIYGNYPIAERYLNRMSKSMTYESWAEAHRKFLYNDAAVEKDSFLGLKRKMIIENNFLYNTKNIEFVFSEIARHDPAGKPAMEYLFAIYLLNKDLQKVEYFLQQSYGTSILPVLPVSLQEAVLILYEPEPEKWNTYKINQKIIDRFTSYKKDFIAARNNPSLRSSIERKYGDTYWYYYMFK